MIGWTLLKLKTYCSAKHIVKRMRRQAIDLEKIFAKEKSDKRLNQNIQRTFKTERKHTSQLKNGSESLKGTSPKKIYRWQTNI